MTEVGVKSSQKKQGITHGTRNLDKGRMKQTKKEENKKVRRGKTGKEEKWEYESNGHSIGQSRGIHGPPRK